MKRDRVILVDHEDNEIGSMDKLEAHRKGSLHRAISVFLFDDDNRWYLQKRAAGKYHSPSLWSNSCCSHPQPGEKTNTAALKRLTEELGVESQLEKLFHFTYKAEVENLIEHEIDHVFVGRYNSELYPNAEEVSDWKLLNYKQIKLDVSENPDSYTQWFRLIYERVNQALLNLQF